MNQLIPHLSRLVAAVVGLLWCWVEPTIPFVVICAFAVLVDMVTAWRLNRRIRARYSSVAADGKLKSRHMSRMISDLVVVFFCIVLAHHIDTTLLVHLGGIHLANYVAAVFCLVQFVSILENESSCNGSTWAVVLQKFLADKTFRHLEIDIDSFERLRKEKDGAGRDDTVSGDSPAGKDI